MTSREMFPSIQNGDFSTQLRRDTQKPSRLAVDGHASSGLVSLAMLAVGIPWGIWTIATLLGDSELVAFNAMAGCFVLLALGYLGLHSLKSLAWCSVIVLLTFRGLAEFIALPTWRFALGDDQVDPIYVRGMVLVLIGFAAFWVGSLTFMRQTRLRFVPQVQETSGRVKFISVVLLGVGAVARLVMWKLGLLSYTAQTGAREALLAYMELFVNLGNCIAAAMVVSAIEVFGKRSPGLLIKTVLWFSITFSLVFGIISGMKQQVLQPLIILSFVYGITKNRLHRLTMLVPLVLVVLVPFNVAYRANLNNGYRASATTIAGLGALLSKTFSDVALSPLSTSEKAKGGFDRSSNRLNTLNDLHDALGLPAPSLLNGDEKVWLAPFYPLVPRVLWPNKPVLNKGQRFSVALGRPDTTSSAMTTIGDLYTLYGTVGVVVGMFLYGICLQLYMNWTCREAISERGLFVYLSLLVPLIAFEIDTVALIAGAVQAGIVAVIVSYAIYGRPLHSLHVARNPRPTRPL